MGLQRISYPDRESWLIGREDGLGGSDAAAVAGYSKWKTSTALWSEKTHRIVAKDKSGLEYVQRGINAEAHIRNFFAAMHPEFEISYHAYDILFQEERPWLRATLDGEILETGWKEPPEGAKVVHIPVDGEPWEEPYARRVPYIRKGALEVKTSEPKGRAGWDEWNGKVPAGYYCQCLHLLLATGFDFVILYAALYGKDESITLRPYTLEREDCEKDMEWLLQKETEFWRCVQTDTSPGAIIRF